MLKGVVCKKHFGIMAVKIIVTISILICLVFQAMSYTAHSQQAPTGTLDLVTDFIVAGWAYDPNEPSEPINVYFYVDGPYNAGTFAGICQTDILREDVNETFGIKGNHGFQWLIPLEFRDGNQHDLYAYVADTESATELTMLNLSPKSFQVASLPTIAGSQQPYQVGAWYFTGWSPANVFLEANSEAVYGRRDVWGGVRDHALGDDPWGLKTDYRDREPLLGFYDLLNQNVMDSHIRQAASSGLTFFAFYWYWNTDTNCEDGVSTPISTFISSPLKEQMKFLIAPIKLGNAPMTLSMWRDSVVPFMVDRYLSDPSYLRTVDGRPVLVLFDPMCLDTTDMVGSVNVLRDYVVEKTGENPLLLWLYDLNAPHTATDLVSWHQYLGIDGYANFTLSPSQPAEPYSQTISRWLASTSAQEGFFHIPCAFTGFDARPWWQIGWGGSQGVNERPYNVSFSETLFKDHLITVRDYLDTHAAETSRTVIIYAWNEWGEGGVIEPSAPYQYQYLDIIKDVFSLTPTINRAPVVTPEQTSAVTPTPTPTLTTTPTITPNHTPTSAPSVGGIGPGAWAGTVIGILVASILAVGLGFWLARRRYKGQG